MSSVVVSGDVSGSVTLSAPSAAGSVTVTLPSASGTMLTSATPFSNGQGPAFSAYLSGAQGTSTTVWTKVTCSTEEFDTNSNYDNATNYRFTPTVAGYYQVNGQIKAAGSSITYANVAIYKNGSPWKEGTALGFTETAQSSAAVGCLIYMNGSTDYIELFGVVNAGAGVGFQNGQPYTYFSASLVRGA